MEQPNRQRSARSESICPFSRSKEVGRLYQKKLKT